jgi:hypothetical protein
MPTEPTPADRRAQVLADLHEAISDKAALLADPEGHTRAVTERCKAAYAQGLIDADDQCEQLEWIDAGYAWAVEELITQGVIE